MDLVLVRVRRSDRQVEDVGGGGGQGLEVVDRLGVGEGLAGDGGGIYL